MCEDRASNADSDDQRVGLIEDAGVWLENGTVRWVGRYAERPDETDFLKPIECDVLFPAFVECHTHALFAGSRHDEFAVRNTGGSYAEILEAGGGIHSTVEATRAATDDDLIGALLARLHTFSRRGCALVEVKTGYGLSHSEELRHLRLLRALTPSAPVDLAITFLGAHAIPPEHSGSRTNYVDEIVNETLPAIAEENLADAVDVFCDRGAFDAGEAMRILGTAESLSLDRRIHTDELSHSHGCPVAADVGAVSADHLEYASADDLTRLAEADVAAVLLPGVTVFLDAERRPRARYMLDRGVRVALSTDYNPGSSHTQDLLLMATLGCTLFKLTPGESLRAVTRVPAEILGRSDRFGLIAPGSDGRLLSASLPSWRALPYHMGSPDLIQRIGFES
jgi:imidazolonepropionase